MENAISEFGWSNPDIKFLESKSPLPADQPKKVLLLALDTNMGVPCGPGCTLRPGSQPHKVRGGANTF